MPTASRNVPLGLMDAYQVGGGEASHIAVDPRDANIVYATISGQVSRTDVARKVSDLLYVYPEPRYGTRAADLKYRSPWNAPLRLSPHDPDVLYTTSQYVHRSRDAGRTWEVISADLTRNDRSKQEAPGLRRLPYEGTGAETYDTIFAFEESKVRRGVLWAGTRAAPGGDVAATAQRLAGELSASESQLTRVPGQTGPRLDSQLLGLYRAIVDGNLAPSPGIEERAADLLPGVDRALAALDDVVKRAEAWAAQHS